MNEYSLFHSICLTAVGLPCRPPVSGDVGSCRPTQPEKCWPSVLARVLTSADKLSEGTAISVVVKTWGKN